MTRREQQLLRWIAENPMISQQELADKAGITRSSTAVHISNLMKKGAILGKGYILRTAPYTVVAGGVNIDIGGTADRALVAADSNPGRVRTSLGGVGRNIAHNMALLGMDVRLVTALGDDANGQRIRRSCGELGIDLSRTLNVVGGSTSTYLFISDERGEMVLALSDMEIYQALTPTYLATLGSFLNGAQLVIADTNLPASSLAWLAEHVKVPLFVDPVSTMKAEKLWPILGKIHTLKPNRLEAQLLSGISITDENSLHRATDRLLAAGLHRVFISLGPDGVLAADQNSRFHLPCCPGRAINATGCGDAFMAALAWSWLEGLELEETARTGLAGASIALEGADTINSNMNAEALRKKARIG